MTMTENLQPVRRFGGFAIRRKKNVLTSLVLRICNPHYDTVVNHTLFCV